MNLDGRVLTIDQLGPHLQAMQWNGTFRPKFAVEHNSSTPDVATWQHWVAAGRPTMEQWLRNLASYYAGMGWNSMPHAFVLPDGRVGLGAPFNVAGTHTPSWNRISIGIEHLAEFDRDQFDGTLLNKASVALTGELCKRLNWMPDNFVLGVRGVHLHREDRATTHKSCPGKNFDKARFVAQVLAYMGDSAAASEPDRNGHVDVPPPVQTADSGALTKDQLTSTLWLQQRLVANGAKIAMDGMMGPKTKAAVLAFQQAHPPLTADSVAGPLTRMALFHAGSA